MDQRDPQIAILERKIEKLQRSMDKMGKIFLWTLIISVALFALPLIGLLFIIPRFLSGYGSILQL